MDGETSLWIMNVTFLSTYWHKYWHWWIIKTEIIILLASNFIDTGKLFIGTDINDIQYTNFYYIALRSKCYRELFIDESKRVEERIVCIHNWKSVFYIQQTLAAAINFLCSKLLYLWLNEAKTLITQLFNFCQSPIFI